MLLLCATAAIFAKNKDEKKEMKKPVEAQHSNIHLQKVTNKSQRCVFVAFERTHIMGKTVTNEPINIAGHIMPEKSFEIKGPHGNTHSVMVPVWQNTFRGNTINLVTLSGCPGKISYLYAINGHLWAIKAPSKESELKGVYLLRPSEEDRKIELEVHNKNVIKVHVLDENGKRNGESTPLAFDEDTDNYVTQKKQEQRYAK